MLKNKINLKFNKIPTINRNMNNRIIKCNTDYRDKCILFHSKDTKQLAEKIKLESDFIELGTIKWNKFNDQYPNLFIEDVEQIRNAHTAFLTSFQDPSIIFEQLSIIYAIPKLFVKSFTLILPYFPTGTYERIEEEGEVATAATMARIISNIPSTRGGPTHIIIYDIHALQERFFFGDNVLPLFESGIPLLLKEIENLEDISIVYPDSGAWKRFHKMFKKFPEIICTKIREGDKRIVKLKEGNPENRNVIIVDDLVQSGGTLVECYNVLKKFNPKSVSMYVTHAVFPKSSWKKFQELDLYKFWITDSCPTTINDIRTSSYQKVKPFEIISLSKSIVDSLYI